MSRNLIARIAVAVVAIPLMLWLCYQGGLWLFGMIALLALVAMSEFLWAEGFRPNHLSFWLAEATVGAVLFFVFQGGALVGQAAPTGWYASVIGFFMPIFFVLTAVAVAIGRKPPGELFLQQARLFWGVCYIAFLYPLVYLVGELGLCRGAGPVSGGDSLLFLFAVLWIGDTSAMWIGSSLGKHKLAPTVSPNKTVEGFLGGLSGALLVGVVMVFWKFSSVPWYHVLVIALGSSFFGQLGDLVESMWKRSVGIKDSSGLIPGHGGILDRFDSLLFGAPFMWFYCQLFL